jgi:hypothetical protein
MRENQSVVFRILFWNITKTFRNPCECFLGPDKYEYLLPKKIGVQFVQVIKKKIPN